MMTSAGIVKITPAAIEAAADAPVWTMLFSRMCPPPKSFNTAIDTTAAGIEDEIVRPANSPRYVLAAARIIARMIDSRIARNVSCGEVEVVAVIRSPEARRLFHAGHQPFDKRRE